MSYDFVNEVLNLSSVEVVISMMLFAQPFCVAFSQGLEHSQMLWAPGELITRAGGLLSLKRV